MAHGVIEVAEPVLSGRTLEMLSSRFSAPRRAPNWAHLGTNGNYARALDAVQEAEANYTVEKWPTFARDPHTGREQATGKYALMKSGADEPVYFGETGSKYTPVQNEALARLLDKELKGTYPVTTVASLQGGRKLILVLDGGKVEIAGEEVQDNWVIVNDHTGRGSLRMVLTPVRMWCMNQLDTALKAALVRTSLRHHGDIHRDLEFGVSVFAQMRTQRQKVHEQLEILARTPIDGVGLDHILYAAYPIPTKSGRGQALEMLEEGLPEGTDLSKYELAHKADNYLAKRMSDHREAARELVYRFNDQHPKHAGTAWAAVNGVVEFEDYKRGSRKNETSPIEAAVVGLRVRTKEAAFKAAFDLVK